MLRILSGIAFVVLCVLGMGVALPLAQATKLVPATATFRCTGSPTILANPLNPCANGDTVAGDAAGAYVGVVPGKNTPQQGTYIDANNDFYFVLQPTAVPQRSVFFDVSQLVAGTSDAKKGFSTLWSDQLQPPTLADPVDANGNSLAAGLPGMQLNQISLGKMKLSFQRSTDSYLWTLRLDQFDYPQSTNVTIVCTAVGSSGRCNAWTISAPAGSRSELIASTTSGRQVNYDEGTYATAFEIYLTQP